MYDALAITITLWCPHKMIQYSSFHNTLYRDHQESYNILICHHSQDSYCRYLHKIRHTRKEMRFKLILMQYIDQYSYDQFLSEDHCYNILNHCQQHDQLRISASVKCYVMSVTRPYSNVHNYYPCMNIIVAFFKFMTSYYQKFII